MFRKLFGLRGHAGRPQRRSPAAPKNQGRSRLQVEQLESRLVPSYTIGIYGGVLTVNCTGGPDTITVSHSGAFAVINGSTFADASYNSIRINGGSGGLTANLQATVKPIDVVGAAGDVVNVGNAGWVGGIQSQVSIRNPPSFTTLNVDDSADGANHTSVVVTAGSITGLAPLPIIYQQTDLRALNISTGTGRNDVFVTSTPSSLVLPHTALIGHSDTTYVDVGNGSLSNIQGALDITNPPHHTSLYLQDWADGATHANVVVTASSVTGLAPATISYRQLDLATLWIMTGTGINIVNVHSAPVSSSPSNFTTIDGGSVSTTVNVGNAGSLSGILGPLYVSQASLNVDDSADALAHANVVVTADANGAITGLAPATIGYNYNSGAVNIAVGTGANTVNVQGTFANQPLTITAQPIVSNLTVNIGTLTHNLDSIQGNVTVNGSRGQATLNIFDQSDAGNEVWTVTPTSVMRTGSAVIAYSLPTMATGSLTIFGGSGISNTYSLSTAVGWLTTLNTGPGLDTVNVVAVNHNVISGGTLVVNAQGSGNDTVNIAAGSNNLDTIRGNVTVNGNSGLGRLNFFDPNNATNVTWSMTAISVQRTGSALVSFSGMGQVTVNGGSGANTYNVSGIGSSSTTLNSNGADTLNVQGTALVGTLTVNTNAGGATVNLTNGGTVDGIANVTVNDPTGTSTVVVDDSAFVGDETYAITNGSVNVGRLASGLLRYSGIANLVVDGGASNSVQNTFNIESTSANTTVTGLSGVRNSFHVSPAAQWLGANILGPLTLHGSGGGADVLEFFDTNDPNSEAFNFDAVPSMLTLGTTPGFLCNFSGFAAGSVYVLTNGFSTANDASGTVVFDPAGGPPSPWSHQGTTGEDLLQSDAHALAQLLSETTGSALWLAS